MLFELDDDQKLLAKTVRDFAREEILPNVMKWDEAQTFPRELFTKMGQQGYLGVVVPEALGGAGMSYQDYVIIVTEISRILDNEIVNISHHLSVLRGTGLVQDVKDGRFVNYSLHPDKFDIRDPSRTVMDLGWCRIEIPHML